MSSLPLQRSLEKARKEGYLVWIVEKHIPFPKPWGHRVDLFNLFDAVGIRADQPGVLGIQACADGDVAAHRTKVMEGYRDKAGNEIPPNPYLPIWKSAGNKAVIWGWGKKGPRGAVKRWLCREVVL